MPVIRVDVNDKQFAHVERLADEANAEVGAVIRALIDLDMRGSVPSKPLSVSRLNDRQLLVQTLHECDGNVSQAARELGEHRRTIQRKIIRYGIARSEYV